MDNYDDDAFKRRDLNHLRAKEMLKQINSQTSEVKTPKPNSKNNQRIGLNSSMKIVNPNRFNQKLREKEFNVNPQNRIEEKSIQDKQRLFSRDERLKIPKSSQIQTINIDREKQISRHSKLELNKVNDNKNVTSKRALNRSLDAEYKTPSNGLNVQNMRDFEGIGSKRKRLLQIANQSVTEDPFIKNRLQTQAAYIQKHIKPSSLILSNI